MTSMETLILFSCALQLDYLPFLKCVHFNARLNVLSSNPLNSDRIRPLNSRAAKEFVCCFSCCPCNVIHSNFSSAKLMAPAFYVTDYIDVRCGIHSNAFRCDLI